MSAALTLPGLALSPVREGNLRPWPILAGHVGTKGYATDVSPWGPWKARKSAAGYVRDPFRWQLRKPWRRTGKPVSSRHNVRSRKAANSSRVEFSMTPMAAPYQGYDRRNPRRYYMTTTLALRRVPDDWQAQRWELIGMALGVLTPTFPYREVQGG